MIFILYLQPAHGSDYINDMMQVEVILPLFCLIIK